MNWLAHLRLGGPERLLRLGNLSGDFVRGADLASLHPDLVRGVRMHQAIDRFVDAHPAVAGSRARLQPHWRHLRGVLVDVFYDHVLASRWHEFGDGRPLRAFVDDVHADLAAHAAALPPRLQQALPWLRSQDWLASYARLDGIEAILDRMARRLSRPAPLAGAVAELRERGDEFAADFAALWPDLVAYAAALAGGAAGAAGDRAP
jgi:acyl carrier protein phosphodiesterase